MCWNVKPRKHSQRDSVGFFDAREGGLGNRAYRLPIGFVTLLLLASLFPRSIAAQASDNSSEVANDLRAGQTALKANDRAKAEEMFRAVLKQDPTNAEAHANLGALAFVRGDCGAAEPDLRSALRTAPSLTKVQALLSICEKRLREDSAQADMTSAFARLEDPGLRLQVGIELADFYYQRGDLGESGSVLYKLSSLNPDNADVLFFEQRVYSELASDTLDKLALLAPGSARMEQLIAERLINVGDLKDATAHYRKALELDPKLPGMHFELAESLMEASPNNVETQKEASAELEAAMQVDGDSAKVECELGRIAMLQSNFDGADTHYRHAYQLSPGDPQAEMGLAELLKQQNKPEEAAKYLRMAIASDPLNAEAHYKLSQVDRELHLDEEQRKEMKLFRDIRATKDKIKLLYQEMTPPMVESGRAVGPDGAP
jgi:cytochrome c-type biogenesis protein CcmH/NrfG